jgi:hypothetical protein
VDEDGLSFAQTEFVGQAITLDKEYPGVRVKFVGHLGNARIPMRVDVGFDDVIVPGEEIILFPSLLGSRAPRIRAYSKESVIAEKLEAMVMHGETLSRIRDLFDVWLLSECFEFEGATLGEAIRQTFAKRGTPIVGLPACLSATFSANQDRRRDWAALIAMQLLEGAPQDLAAVASAIAEFIGPVLEALARGSGFEGWWLPAGPWHDASLRSP